MLPDKKFSVKIYSPEISTGRKWYVEWYDNGRKRKYGNINSFETFEERMKRAKEISQEIQQNLGGNIWEPVYDQLEKSRSILRDKTYNSYRSKLDIFFRYHRGQTPNNKTTSQFFNQLRSTHHKTTINDYRRRLMMFFPDHPEWFEEIKKLRSESTPARYFQSYQVKRLKKWLIENDPVVWLACQFQYYCFIRPGRELHGLRTSNILFDEWKILVPPDIAKNKKNQYVTIPVAFRPNLEQFRERSASEYLFHPEGKPFTQFGKNTLRKRHRKALRACTMDTSEFKFYSWKHTGAVACIKAGISIKELQIQLRHSSLEEVDRYLRQLGISDLVNLENKFPKI